MAKGEQGQHIGAQGYLDAAGTSYLFAINGVSQESLERRAAEMAPLTRHLSRPRTVMSIGVGQGEEIHALQHAFKGGIGKIIGVDLSQNAVEAARERAKRFYLPTEFIIANASDLPLKDKSVDGAVLSSLMHEVYSYSPNGKEAWDKAVRESTRVLDENGCMFLRDSAAPEIRSDMQIRLDTPLAREFYDYFGAEFRTFSGWESSLKTQFPNPASNLPAFPDRGKADTVDLTPGQAAELLFHFVNFSLGYPNDPNFIGNRHWKELNETYYIPREHSSPEPMRTQEYVGAVFEQGNLALVDTDFALTCVEQDLSVRPRMAVPITQHFTLGDVGEPLTDERNGELVPQFTKKMELVFKKVRKQ